MTLADQMINRTRKFSQEVSGLTFSLPVTHVYRPLDYAWEPHKMYLKRYASGQKRVVFLGMNPGPWGMAQTGIPFGDVDMVVSWLNIKAPVSKPKVQHPKRQVEGFSCQRSEVSGKRLWGMLADRFRTAESFFQNHFVANYCPLLFIEESGRNRTPDRLPKVEKEKLMDICDRYLVDCLRLMEPEWVVGIGNFTFSRARQALGEMKITVGQVLHPSPASPSANRGWARAATQQLVEQKIW